MRSATNLFSLQACYRSSDFDIGRFDKARVKALFGTIQRYSLLNDRVAWEVETILYGSKGVGCVPDALSEVARNRWRPETRNQASRVWAAAYCQRRTSGSDSGEGVSLLRNDLDQFEFSLGVRVDPKDRIALFTFVAQQLELPWMHYLPDYEGPAGATGAILDMALERDYGMFGGFDLRSIELAKTLSPMLPRLRFQLIDDNNGVPTRLGWLNWWSPHIAQILGFPDPDKDARVLPLCHRTETGAWLVKLTEDSLDLTRPDHAEAIAWAYWRFDKIGKRMLPTAKKAKPRVKRSDSDVATALGLKLFILRECDENDQWWDAAVKPIRAASADDALRIYFARNAHGRTPKPRETLDKLRDAYDGVAAEVGLTPGNRIEAIEAESRSSEG